MVTRRAKLSLGALMIMVAIAIMIGAIPHTVYADDAFMVTAHDSDSSTFAVGNSISNPAPHIMDVWVEETIGETEK